MSLNVGELVAFLRLDTAQFDQAINRVQGSAGQAGQAVNRGLGQQGAAGANQLAGASNQAAQSTQQIAPAAGLASKALKTMGGVLAGATVVDYLRDSITASSDLNETISKSQQIFGSSAAEIEKWGDTAATSVGLSKAAALDAATNFGNVFTQIGFTSEAAADLSTSTVQLAADLGSFNNLATADVADKISAAFNGEFDSLQALVPGINAARVETEAMAASGKTSADALTAQEKATAVLAIVTADGSKALGDFARTSDGFANQSKITAATIEDQKAALGDKLMPVVQQLMQVFTDVGIPALDAFGTILGGLAGAAEPFIGVLGDGVRGFTELAGPVQAATVALVAVALLRGPLNALWTSIQAGVATATASMGAAAAGATGFGAASAVASAGIARLGLALKAAFLSNPLGIALVGITTAVALFSDTTEDATPPVTDFTAAIDAQTGALTANAQASVAKALADSGSLEAASKLGIAADTYTRAVLGEKDAIDQVNAAIAAGTTVTTAAYNDYGNSSAQYTRQTEDAAAAAAAFAADQGGFADAQKKTQQAIEGAGTAAEQAVEPAVDLGEALKDGGDAAGSMSDAISVLQNRLTELAGGQVDAEQAAREHEATIRSVAGAARDYAEARADEAAAIAEVTQLERDGKAGTEEYAAAQRAASDATAAVSDAADSQADSLDALAQSAQEQVARTAEATEATSGYDAAVQAATAKMVEQRTQFIESATAAGVSQEAAEQLADAQGLIPANVATAYDAIRADESKKKAEDLKAAVEAVPANKAITISLNDLASVGISGLASAISGLPNTKTVTVQVNANTSAAIAGGASAAQIQGAILDVIGVGWTGGMAGAIPGFASGGMLPGTPPANPRMDNLLAIGPSGGPVRLRSREWIINQSVSDRLGPQIMGGINAGRFGPEFFRNAAAAQGFAAGGQVVTGPTAGASTTVSPTFNVHVQLGDREITDIIDVRIERTDISADKMLRGLREYERRYTTRY